MIIFLNGTSSSGKSVIAREIMRQSERPFLYYSVDHLLNFWIDEKFIALEDEAKAWFFKQHMPDSKVNVSVQGPNPQQLHWDLIESLGVLITKGYDIIIDEVLWEKAIFEKFSRILVHSDSVYLVKIICDLIEVEKREKLREDRYKGMARGLYKQVYQEPPSYDLTVDTTYLPKQSSAKTILDFVETHHKPQAFLNYLRNQIRFEKLKISDFDLLHRWLNQRHLAKTWGEQKAWSFNDIKNKYLSYVHGYKLENQKKITIHSFIIYCANHPIGYIQYYNAYDFPRDEPLVDLPTNLAAIDIYIGETDYLNKGLGVIAINNFVTNIVLRDFSNCLVDPDIDNVQAIHAYEKAGFKRIKSFEKRNLVWMLFR